jgi:hypothetical protein
MPGLGALIVTVVPAYRDDAAGDLGFKTAAWRAAVLADAIAHEILGALTR